MKTVARSKKSTKKPSVRGRRAPRAKAVAAVVTAEPQPKTATSAVSGYEPEPITVEVRDKIHDALSHLAEALRFAEQRNVHLYRQAPERAVDATVNLHESLEVVFRHLTWMDTYVGAVTS